MHLVGVDEVELLGVLAALGKVVGRVTQRRVSSQVNATESGVSGKVLLRQQRVGLDLVDGRDDTGSLDDTLDVGWGEVGDTDRLDLACLLQGNHGLPGVGERSLEVQVDLLGVLGVRWHELLVRLDVAVVGHETDWPVNEVEIEVVELELLQGVVVCSLDIGWAVSVVPELAGDEEVLSLDARLEQLFESLTDLVLVLVDAGEVEVLVARLDGVDDGGLDLTGLRQPSAESDDGDGVTVVELERL